MSSGSAAQWSQGLSAGAGGGGGAGGQQQQQQRDGGVASRLRRWRWSPRRAAARARVAAAEGWRRAWVLSLWLAAMASLFAWRFVQYRRSSAFRVMGYCLPTAKGAAETLKLNMALVLLPVCRNTLTWLRSTWARFFVPFDDSIAFHKVINKIKTSILYARATSTRPRSGEVFFLCVCRRRRRRPLGCRRRRRDAGVRRRRHFASREAGLLDLVRLCRVTFLASRPVAYFGLAVGPLFALAVRSNQK
jgi:hypothetical protein